MAWNSYATTLQLFYSLVEYNANPVNIRQQDKGKRVDRTLPCRTMRLRTSSYIALD
jgi:hypothetical protein